MNQKKGGMKKETVENSTEDEKTRSFLYKN
jgi:hypothetical protein